MIITIIIFDVSKMESSHRYLFLLLLSQLLLEICSYSAIPQQKNHHQIRFNEATILPETEEETLELSIDDNTGYLASLFGSNHTRDEFFNGIIGRKVAYYPRSESTRTNLPLVGIDLQSLYQTNDWISLRQRGSRDLLDKAKMSYKELQQYIANGGSAVISIIPGDYMHEFKIQIEQSLGDLDTCMNVYHSGPSAVALNIHYDTYDVLVLQLQGHKEWIIQDNSFFKSRGEITQWKNVTMTEGDLLYIPKGVFHAATTAEGYDTTTHVTIGLLYK